MSDLLQGSSAPISPGIITVYGSSVYTPTIVNEYTSLTIPTFWSAVRYLSETLASMPKRVMDDQNGVNRKTNHPVNKLLTRKINQFTIPFVFWEVFFSHAIVWGNGYGEIVRDKLFRPKELWTINPERVIPFRMLRGPQMGQWYYIRADAQLKQDARVVHGSDIIHLPGLGFDGMCGYPVVFLMAEQLELARNINKFAGRYFKKGTQVQGSIEVPATTPQPLIDQMVKTIKEQHSGIENDYSFMVVTGGGQLKNSTIAPEASQLIESRKFSVIEICRMLRVPPHVVYDFDRATWGNAETMSLEAIKFTFRNWIEKTEEILTDKLLTDQEQDNGLSIVFDIDSLLRGNSVEMTDIHVKRVNGGIEKVNEARAAIGLPPDEDPASDKLRVPHNFPVPGITDQASLAANVADPTAAPAPSQNAQQSAQDAPRRDPFEQVMPVIEDACNRVETKTNKAFEAHELKPDKAIWANVFAEQQANFVRSALEPAAAILQKEGQMIDLDKIAARYAGQIRRRAATGEYSPLREIFIDSRGDHGKAK